MFAFQRELANNWSLNVDWIQRWFRDATTDQNCYGLPCNTVASTVYSPTRVVTDSGAGQHSRHGRRSLADLLRRAAGVPRQGHVLPHQLRQQRHLRLHAALQGGRVLDRQADVEPLADAGVVRVVAARRRAAGHQHQRHRARPRTTSPTRTTRSTRVGQGRGANDQPHAFKLLGSYQAPWGINLGANFQALSGLPIDRTLTRRVRAGLARHPGRTARHLPRRLRSTCCRCAPTRASGSAATARRSSPSCTTCSTRAPARAATAR